MKTNRPDTRRAVVRLLLGGTVFCAAPPARSADAGTNAPPSNAKSSVDLMSLDLDALANTKVTSVSKKEEKLFDAATAITVLSNDDIRRSGATSVAEALRLVPGADVAQINSGTWAISVRGFDEIYSRSLLVLVDGRTVFAPFNGGVDWDLQQQMLEDLDRIEVIRGPGGTLWGANAVNGVINIVSKSARDTQGALMYASGGNVHQTMDGARYGGMVDDNTYYRVFGSFQKTASFDNPDGTSAGTGYEGGQGGFRFDHYGKENSHATWQGDFTYNDLLDHSAHDYNFNTLGRWDREISDRSSVEVQAYLDRKDSDAWGGINLGINTFDIAAQNNIALGEHNDAVWGVGYRLWDLHLRPISDPSLVRDSNFTEQRANIFAQDEFKIIPGKLSLTAGMKLEYNDITGVEFEPNVRAMFKPAANQTLWAAVSRSVLVPTLKAGHDGYLQSAGDPYTVPGQGLLYPSFLGNPDIKSAPVWTYELGYRIQPVSRVSVDVAGYYSRYSRLQNQVDTGNVIPFNVPHPGSIEVQQWQNSFEAETYGGEASVTVQPVDEWRVTGFYSLMKIREWGPVPDTDVLGGSPMQQVGLRSAYDFTRQASIDGQMRYVDRVAGADAYLTADLRLSYRPTEKIELAVVGQNLFQPRHIELGAGQFGEVPRGIYGKVSIRF